MPLKILIDADLPRRTAEVCRRFGHTAVDGRDIGLGSATDPEIAAHAQRQGACLFTGDFGFADVRNYPPDQYAGIVVFALSPDATAFTILALVQSLLSQNAVVARLPGRLAIAEPGRVRLRPP